MNCRQAQHHLFSGRDVALTDDERASLAAHLAGCASCRQIQENLSTSLESLRADAEKVRLPDADIEWHKVRRRLRETEPGIRRSLVPWLALPIAAAAAIALGIYIIPPALRPPAPVAHQAAVASAVAANHGSTVIFVDEKSGWTFVLAPENPGNGQRI